MIRLDSDEAGIVESEAEERTGEADDNGAVVFKGHLHSRDPFGYSYAAKCAQVVMAFVSVC